jgi:hypothetical protein
MRKKAVSPAHRRAVAQELVKDETCSQRRAGPNDHHRRASLYRATSQFVLPYHAERNRQGLENKIIRPEFPVFPDEGKMVCRKRLGGLLRCHHREAA